MSLFCGFWSVVTHGALCFVSCFAFLVTYLFSIWKLCIFPLHLTDSIIAMLSKLLSVSNSKLIGPGSYPWCQPAKASSRFRYGCVKMIWFLTKNEILLFQVIYLVIHWLRTWAILQKPTLQGTFGCSDISIIGTGGKGVFYPDTWLAVQFMDWVLVVCLNLVKLRKVVCILVMHSLGVFRDLIYQPDVINLNW